jgi:ribonuclease HII
MPDFAFEQRLGGLVVGIDEAGRGPWAGPVFAAAVILDATRLAPRLAREIDDSKRLTQARREAVFAALQNCAEIACAEASVEEIDRLNILNATLLAMQRAFAALGRQPDHALIDGNRAPDLPCPSETVIGGDHRSLSIAAASIVAKVNRDRLMKKLAVQHPGYGWERNFGYGTFEHQLALVRLGPTNHHRKSFKPIRNILNHSAESRG